MKFIMEINKEIIKLMAEENVNKDVAFQVLCSRYIKSGKFKLVTKDKFEEYKDLEVLKYFNNAIYAYRQYYIFNYLGEYVMIDYSMFLVTKHVIDIHATDRCKTRRLEVNWQTKDTVIRIRNIRFSIMTLYRSWHEHERVHLLDSDIEMETHHVNEIRACNIVDNLVPLVRSEHATAHSFIFFKLAEKMQSNEDYDAYRTKLMKGVSA